MPNKTTSFNFGISKTFPCSYLADHEERLLVLIEPQTYAKAAYPMLLENGFRRSGDQVYRPHCEHCQACQSLRIPIAQFVMSRSQKRLVNKNKLFRIAINHHPKDEYFDLYQDYINRIHSDGVMYPASREQYEGFIRSSWHNALFIEIYDQDKLIAVSVTDQLENQKNNAWSAFYCFYNPDYSAYSLGKYAVLTQLKLAKAFNIDWLYLGYYIEKCQKMNYKTQFRPHQRFINGNWISFNQAIKKAFI